MSKRVFFALTLCAAGIAGTARPASAGFITSPTAVLQNTGGEFNAAFAITNAIDQSGLSATFTSGVTDFDTYLAGNPTHTPTAAGFEWFTPSGVNASTIIFDLGVTNSINRIALWNEELSGVNTMIVETSDDSTFATSALVGSFTPINNPNNASYSAEVLDLTDTTARYVRLQVTGPQANATFNGIGIGEIAFDLAPAGPAAVAPAPATWLAAVLGGGLVGMVRRARGRSRA